MIAARFMGGRSAPPRGYSLVELLIVLALLALASAVVLPAVARAGFGDERRAVRTEVIEMVRGAQTRADLTGLTVHVQYHPRTRRFVVGDREHRFSGSWRPVMSNEPGLSPEAQNAALRLQGERGVTRIVSAEDADAPVTLMSWSPGGMSSATDWTLLNDRGMRVRVWGDAIDGVRVE